MCVHNWLRMWSYLSLQANCKFSAAEIKEWWKCNSKVSLQGCWGERYGADSEIRNVITHWHYHAQTHGNSYLWCRNQQKEKAPLCDTKSGIQDWGYRLTERAVEILLQIIPPETSWSILNITPTTAWYKQVTEAGVTAVQQFKWE